MYFWVHFQRVLLSVSIVCIFLSCSLLFLKQKRWRSSETLRSSSRRVFPRFSSCSQTLRFGSRGDSVRYCIGRGEVMTRAAGGRGGRRGEELRESEAEVKSLPRVDGHPFSGRGSGPRRHSSHFHRHKNTALLSLSGFPQNVTAEKCV